MTSNNSEVETSDIEALKKEAEHYRNLIRQHESKQLLSLKNNASFKKVHSPISDCKKFNLVRRCDDQPKDKTNMVKNRTVIKNSLTFQRPSNTGASTHTSFKNNHVWKNTSFKSSSFSLSNVPKVQPSGKVVCNLKPPVNLPLITATSSYKSKHNLFLQKQNTSSDSKVLMEKIDAMKNKLKEASKTLVPKHKINKNVSSSNTVPNSNSSQKLNARKIFINPLFSKNDTITMAKTGLNMSSLVKKFPLSSTAEHLDGKEAEISNSQNVSKSLLMTKTPVIPKTIILKTPVCAQIAVPAKNSIIVQKVLTPKTAVTAKKAIAAFSAKKATSRLVSSKFKLVNKKTPSLSLKTTDVEQVNRPRLPNSPMTNKGKERLKVVSSKYKIINKKSPVGLNISHSKFVSVKSPNMRKNVFISKNQKTKINKIATPSPKTPKIRKSTYISKNQKTKINKIVTPVPKSPKIRKTVFISKNQKTKINKITAPIKSVSNRYSKSFRINKSISKTPKLHLSSMKRSKFKVINKTSALNSAKKKKVLKIGSSNKVFNFSSDMDVDLLMELAAEKKSQAVASHNPRKNIIRQVFKTRNTLVNKNVSSPQVKTAQMIKSKYFATNRKHVWLNKAKSSKFVNNYFAGSSKKNHAKFFTPFNQRRHTVKQSMYTSSHYSKNVKRVLYSQQKYKFASHRSLKRKSINPSLYRKISNTKYSTSTPVSKILASRVLQHSISRVLTASSKKTSKVNTYCMFYNRFGRCNKGTQCMYIHDPSKIAICTRFLRGTCKKEDCPFSHEISPGKMAICSFFLSGSCTKTNCPYRHEKLKPGAELCKAFVKGYCPKGKLCQKAHVLICPDYVQGSCDKGDACAFPHPPPKEKKQNIEKIPEKLGDKDSDELLMESVCRYFEPSKGELQCQNQFSTNSVVPQRKTLPEQPSFIALSLSDDES